jgi:phage-related protein
MAQVPRPFPKPLKWVGSAKRDLVAMPEDVKDVFGFAIDLAQAGGKHQDAKPMKGFGSAGVLEVVDDFRGDTYRAIYTVKFDGWVYVLHCFQKKSRRGIKTSKEDLDLINARLKAATLDFEAWQARQGER